MPTSSENEFVRLIQQHSGIIYKIINLYVDDKEDKRDLHQEILLQAWKSYQRFKGNSSFATWLYKVSLNTVLTFNKKNKKHSELQVNDTATTESTTDKKEQSELLYYLVRQLNEVDRMIMTLHLEGYKNLEIADITGLKVNHINVKLHRLKSQIIEQLKKNEK
ncbi:MAG: RNA polymerase sigma factor [Saprospiraceae bacterium]